MSASRLVRSVALAAGICVLAAAGPGSHLSGQQPAPPPRTEATFRTDASFVLTDVFVTADGKPVTDLTAADFEVREDGVVQTIRSFEAIRHDANPRIGVPRRSPSTVAESEAMAADPRRRVFVVFLDTYHVEKMAAMQARKQLLAFLKTSLGPDDLVAYLTPQMSGGDISFSTSTDPILRYLDDNPIWGVADELPGTESDEIERDLSTCNGANWLAVRSRLREQKSLQALRGLVAYLDGLRESRKAVIRRLTPARPGVPLVVSAAAGGKAALPKGARTVEIEVPVVEGMAGDVKVQVRLSGNGPLARYTDTTNVSLDAMPAGWGAPRLSRRGPSTGVAWVPTADPRFRRQERLRVSVGVGPEAGTVAATLLDRFGRPMNVPVKVDQTEPAALVAELALAPLAVGDYVLALGGGPKRLLVPLRIVP